MKFKTYNRINSSKRCFSETPHVRMHVKTGSFHFNAAAISLLGLTAGMRVEFLQSEDNPSDWYMATNRPKGFLIGKHTSGHQIHSKFLCDELVSSLNIPADKKSILFPLASEIDPDANAYVILTSSL